MSKGMCCDFAVHDDGTGNPHAHILLTMRGLDEQGKWLPKSKSEFVLDGNGQRIRQKNGRWKCRKVNTVDWDDRKYCDVWRHEWELLQNQFLQQAGRSERVDMRSYERQGVDLVPTVHMGPAITNMERSGVSTDMGILNREIQRTNQFMRTVQELIQKALQWISRFQSAHISRTPSEKTVADYLWEYAELRQAQREGWNASKLTKLKAYAKDLNRINEANRLFSENGIITTMDLEAKLNTLSSRIKDERVLMKQLKAKCKVYASILNCRKAMTVNKDTYQAYSKRRFKKSREKYYAEHKESIDTYMRASRYLQKYSQYDGVSPAELKSHLEKAEAAIQQKTESLKKEQRVYKRMSEGRRWIQRTITQEEYAAISDPHWKPSIQKRLRHSQQKAKEIGQRENTIDRHKKYREEVSI